MVFDNFDLKDYIVRAIKDINFKSFSDVQLEVFNKIKMNKNLLVRSKTGSGKTHAFLIPIFNTLDEKSKKVHAVIVSPTKELAMQTYKVAQHIASFCGETLDIRLYSGGTDRSREIEKLNSSQPQIVIATPGKIKDLAVDENALKIYTASYYVIDEVDMALDSGYAEDLDVVASILKDSKMMFFSATISDKIFPFIKKYLDTPEYINIENSDNLKIDHYWIPIKHKDRFEVLLNLMEIINPYLAIVFANKKENVMELARNLRAKGYKVGEIHGDLSPRERKRFLTEANTLKYQYIVATDLAARGIDIDGVSHIINYEIPKDFEFYVHRSGRTGRMNYTGTVYSLYNDLDDVYLDNLAKKGINPMYRELKNGELVEYKGRNTRQSRVKPLNTIEKQARKLVKKPTKVTPGYKKKMQETADKIAAKMYEKENKKKKRYR